MADEAKPGLTARQRLFGTRTGWLAIELIAVTLTAILAGRAMAALLPPGETPFETLAALLVAVLVIAVYTLCRRKLEGEVGGGEFALPGAPQELGGGLLFGFLLFSMITGAVALLGAFEVYDLRFPGQLWSLGALSILSGVTEETLFRGIAFRHIEARWGSVAALTATSAFFGLAHLANPNATLFAALAIAIEAGVMLGAAFMLTRRLWLAVGIHAGWNFTQGWVYSVPISGTAPPLGLLASRRIGPDWLTGGDFGLEASVVAMAMAGLAGLGLLWLAARRGQVQPFRRRAGDHTKL